MNFEQVLQLIFSGIATGALYGLIAVGFTVIFNTSSIINIAQGEFAMLGGMATVYLYTVAKLPLAVAAVLAILITAVLGVLMERLTIHPIAHRKYHVMTYILITFGMVIVFSNMAMLSYSRDVQSIPSFVGYDTIRLLGAAVTPMSVLILAVLVVLMVGLNFLFNHTMFGKAMKATAVDRETAALMGIPAQQMVTYSFAISAAIGAVSGILITPLLYTQYSIGMQFTMKGFVGAVIGGLGNIFGAIAGGIILGVLESLSAGLISSGMKDAITFGVLIIVLIFKPAGLFPALIEREEI